MRNRMTHGLGILIVAAATVSWAKSPSAVSDPVMPSIIEQFTADSRSLDRTYPAAGSHTHIARFEKFDNDELARLASLNFEALSESDKSITFS